MKVEPPVKSGACTGAAWLSSARVVRCWVKSRNERNHYPMLLPRVKSSDLCVRTLRGLPGITRRKVEMTSSQYGLYALGYTRVTMVDTESRQPVRGSQSHKINPSSDWSLQFDSMKPESLVMGDQLAPVNTFPGLVHTARQAMKARSTRSPM
jgi:hypothetical protein